MTVATTGGITAVLTRMAAIESRFGATAALRSMNASATTSVRQAESQSFESLLGTELDLRAPATVSPTPTSSDYDALFQAAGSRYGVDPDLLAAVARTESGMDPTAVSSAGAQGLMQLMPGTAAGLGVTDPFDPAQAVDGAARLLRSHLDRFGSVDLALAAYNAGAGAVAQHGGIPPYPETQAYVRRVLDLYRSSS